MFAGRLTQPMTQPTVSEH